MVNRGEADGARLITIHRSPFTRLNHHLIGRLDRVSPTDLGAGQFRFGWFCAIRGNNVTVVAVALNWLAASLTNDALESLNRLHLRGGRAGHVENFFFQDGAVQIVHAVTERDLCKRKSHAHPISSKMIDVIEIDAADSEIAKLLKRGSRFDVRKHRGLRFERERNEAGEAAGFILQLAEPAQMIDAVGESFDMSVEHRASAATAHAVPGAMDIGPLGGSFFSAADLIPHDRIENFRAAAGDRTQAVLA